MIDRQAVSRYARALVELSKDRKVLEKIDQELLAVREMVDRHREISHLLANSSVSLVEKEDFIGKIVPDSISKIIVHFLKVLVSKGRFLLLGDIQDEFHRLFEKEKGIRRVEVITASPISTFNQKKLVGTLKKKFNSEIKLLASIDAALLGGMVLRFDGSQIDASYRSKLEEIRQSLTV